MSTAAVIIVMLSVGAPTLYYLIRHLLTMSAELRRKRPDVRLLASTLRRLAALILVALATAGFYLFLPAGEQDSMKVETLAQRQLGQGARLDEMRRLGSDAWRVVDPLTMPTLSLEDEHHWLRVPIPASKSEIEYVAELHFTMLESVEFALERGDKIDGSAAFGVKADAAPDVRLGVFPNFGFRADPVLPSVLYVRVAGNGMKIFALSVLEKAEYARRSIQATLVKGLALGCLLGILLYNLSLFLALRDKTYLLYAVYQLALLCVLMAYSGLLPVAIASLVSFPGAMQTLINALLFVALLAFTPFYISFLGLRQGYPLHMRMLYASAGLTLAALLLLPVMEPVAQFLVVIGVLVVMSTSAILSLVPRLGQKHVFRFLVGFVGFFACAFVHVLSLFDIVPANAMSDQVIYLGAVWDGIFVSLAIAARVQDVERERDSLLLSLSDKGQTIPAGAARSMHVSIMLVDVANFALIADRFGSAAVYRALSRRMQDIRQIVAELKGTVDRSLGDGLLCFFAGDDGESALAHASRAFEAAIRIQRLTSHPAGSDNGKSGLFLPLRIGLHADDVLIGNLGGMDRVDFAVIGKGVELAHRLETAANPFKIVVSQEFYDCLGGIAAGLAGFHRLHTAISFQEGLLAAFEFNPFAASPQVLQAAERAFVESLGISSRDARVRFVEPGAVTLVSTYGRFRVKDLSLHGMGAVGDTFIGRRAIIAVAIETGDAGVASRLSSTHLQSIQVEVRWCRENGGSFEHGFRIVGLNGEQKQALLTALSQLTAGVGAEGQGQNPGSRGAA